ncbi:MAG: glucose-6-phosphate isomerase [Deltaproteobacteria bacterium]|nr:MAG: glucose-6-phosphate isomerase [Deltaproteobacteria bacterium]
MDFNDFTRTESYQSLLKRAENPYDLSAERALLHEERLERYVCRTSLFNVHFGTQRVDDGVLADLQKMADELQLTKKFQAMRKGAFLNRIEGFESENRQVLHTASRDIFRRQACEPVASARAKAELERLRLFLEEIDGEQLTGSTAKPFRRIVHIGIGGSDLGPRAIYEALTAYGLPGREVLFIANVDPDDAARQLSALDLESTLVVVVSKSGSTIETLTNETLAREALKQAGLDPRRHCVAVTGEGSPMDNPERYLRCFYMYDYIGGRYSVTSMVGAVSLAFFVGIDLFMEFLAGADEMDRLAEEREIMKNPALLLALLGVWNHNFLGYPTLAVLPYSQALHRFPAHLQQCDMESNGKSVDRNGAVVVEKTGPILWGEPGTNGQHAFYQLLHQGTEIVPIEFIGFVESQYQQDLRVKGSSSQQKLLANLYAQAVAFAVGQRSANPNRNFAGNRPSSIIMGRRLDPKTLGALLALYEAKIVYQGFCWNINSFDQEGVQLGKLLATSFLQYMVAERRLDESLESHFLRQMSFGEKKSFCVPKH